MHPRVASMRASKARQAQPPSPDGNAPRIAIVTLPSANTRRGGGGPEDDLARSCFTESKRAYAARHGYAFLDEGSYPEDESGMLELFPHMKAEGKLPHFQKLRYLLHLMYTHQVSREPSF